MDKIENIKDIRSPTFESKSDQRISKGNVNENEKMTRKSLKIGVLLLDLILSRTHSEHDR